MASDATIRAIEMRIKDLEYKRGNMKQWMDSCRNESLKNYRYYKDAKADYIRFGKSIKELKDDFRRIKDGN